MSTNPPPTLMQTVWPPAKRKAQEAQAAREREAEAQRQTEQAQREARKQAEAEALRVQAYKAHIQAVDLNGVGTRDGKPLSAAELLKEVEKRVSLAADVARDPQLTLADKMSDADIKAITGKLDATALDWLLENKDPERQRAAAKKILDARADLSEKVPLDHYATVVAEAVARSRGLKLASHRKAVAVMVRAILLRSADARWQRQRQGALPPLSGDLH